MRKLSMTEVVTLLKRDFPSVTDATIENHRRHDLVRLPDKTADGRHGYSHADYWALREHFASWKGGKYVNRQPRN